MQATHFVSSSLFTTIHVPQSHEPSAFLNLSPNPRSPVETGAVGVDAVLTAEKVEGIVIECLRPVPGLAVSQATHFTASGLLETRHVSQSQVPAGLENIGPKPMVDVVAEEEEVVVAVLLLSGPNKEAVEGLLSKDFDGGGELGFEAIQQTHFVSDSLFCTKHTSQFHPAGALNKSPNPVEETAEEVVVAVLVEVEEEDEEDEEVEREGAVVFCGVSSGPGEVRATGEAKPGNNK